MHQLYNLVWYSSCVLNNHGCYNDTMQSGKFSNWKKWSSQQKTNSTVPHQILTNKQITPFKMFSLLYSVWHNPYHYLLIHPLIIIISSVLLQNTLLPSHFWSPLSSLVLAYILKSSATKFIVASPTQQIVPCKWPHTYMVVVSKGAPW